MRKRGPPPPPSAPDDDDAALFRQAIGPVRRLKPSAAPVTRPPPPARPRQREADEDAALQQMRHEPFTIEAGELLRYRRPEVAPRVLDRLRRGQYRVEDEIDLHGLPAVDAERLLRAFLQQARRRGGCLRVIHGKGLRSLGEGGPVLKPLVERLLLQRRDVLAMASAPPSQGGSGAVLVLLARPRPGEAALSRDDVPVHGAD
jgi:DNA-nicking Smr family endonuclease